MSTVHYWADLHFGHEFVAKLRGYESAEAHDQAIIAAWQEAVHPRDTIWILGDLAASSPTHALGIIRQLPGTKHLIAGNHDRCHPMHRDAHRQQRKYLEVFASVQPFARQRINGTEIMLSHFAYQGDHADRVDRYQQYRLRDRGMPLIHGHVHDEWKANCSTNGTPQINVGFDHWPKPATQTDLERLINV